MTDFSHSKDDMVTVLSELIEQYEQIEEKSDDSVTSEDASMKATVLRSVKQDVERFE